MANTLPSSTAFRSGGGFNFKRDPELKRARERLIVGGGSIRKPRPGPGGRRVQEPHPGVVEAARRGDRAAFEVLVRAHQADVWRLCLHLLGDRPGADDATQEAFVRV